MVRPKLTPPPPAPAKDPKRPRVGRGHQLITLQVVEPRERLQLPLVLHNHLPSLR